MIIQTKASLIFGGVDWYKKLIMQVSSSSGLYHLLFKNSLQKFLGCRDPRKKHEHLNSGQIWLTITEGEEEEEENGDESDKHI